MDVARLITIVQEYEEIYNVRHPEYSNILRRDNIWDEIEKRMNEPSKIYKERWTKTRDNFRKAMNLRKTKSGQAASKLKPPKYEKEIAFLAPYMNDEQERRSNLSQFSPTAASQESDIEEESENSEIMLTSPVTLHIPSPSPTTSDTLPSTSNASATSSIRGKKRIRKVFPQNSTAASVLQNYLSQKEKVNPPQPADPLTDFFVSMANTTKTFPKRDQILIKNQLFKIVNDAELRLLNKSTATTESNISPGVHDQQGCIPHNTQTIERNISTSFQKQQECVWSPNCDSARMQRDVEEERSVCKNLLKFIFRQR